MTFIRNGFNSVSTAVVGYCNTCKQSADSVILTLKNLRNDPEVFQKTCQVAFATIQYVNWQRGTNVLSKFTFALSTANMHDFYLIFKEPRQWLFPVTADTINAHAVLDSMVDKLSASPAFTGVDGGIVRSIAHRFLKAQLEDMAANHEAYRTVEEFQTVLERRMRAAGEAGVMVTQLDGSQLATVYDLRAVDLVAIDVPLFSNSLAERITNATWLAVDFGCVGLYLQGWNLLDTAKLADKVGQYQTFSWVKNQTLETWVRGAVCFAYSLKLFEAVRKLLDEQLTPQARTRAKWDMVTSAAEVVFNGAGYVNKIGLYNVTPGFIHLSAIVAKSLGIFSIATRQKRDYFEAAVAA